MTALVRLNPHIPAAVLDDAARQVIHGNAAGLVQANRQFHRWLTAGVPVEINKQVGEISETLGDFVRLIDFANPDNNEWLAVNQYSIEGPKHTRRPHIVVFVNGLPLAVIELKNQAIDTADIWAAFNQLQTYKEDITDLFVFNEVLAISDYTLARVGSLSADQERFGAWRTIDPNADGVNLDPLGELQQLETLIRGLFRKDFFLDYLRRNLSVDWSVRETVHAKMRAQIKLILKRHKYPPNLELRAVELVLRQADALSEVWMV